MSDFSKEISDFQKNGTYDYKFDEGGNIVLNISSSNFNQQYISIPIENYKYNNVKINSFFNTEFKEFLPTELTSSLSTTSSISVDVAQLSQENQDLKTKLDTLTKLSDNNITDSERLAIKQIIIGLRIQLKQGSIEQDFSTAFPYLPITKKS